jgi:hypothetical protein
MRMHFDITDSGSTATEEHRCGGVEEMPENENENSAHRPHPS